MIYKFLDKSTGPHARYTNDVIADFLFKHLDQYGDKKEDILKCLDYVFDKNRGGMVLVGLQGEELIGVVVINETGMTGYIPENILVYIAVHNVYRGTGVGRVLMEEAIRRTKGGVALHVEPDNPAVHLYKKLGFTSKYMEMRLNKDAQNA